MSNDAIFVFYVSCVCVDKRSSNVMEKQKNENDIAMDIALIYGQNVSFLFFRHTVQRHTKKGTFNQIIELITRFKKQ